jgi:predicted Zn finger-like uncharacterized protein
MDIDMITNCPACDAQFKLNKEKFGGKQVTLKCVKCHKVFQVNVPEPARSAIAIHVLIAHSDQNLTATIQDVLQKADISCQVSHDGPGALTLMKAKPPHVVIVDVALPGLYAFEVVEKVRSIPGLENVKIILLSSVYNKMAYKRTPASLYGADAYIEKHHIPNDLVAYIHRLVTDAEPTEGAAASEADEETVAGEAPSPDEELETRQFTDEVNTKIQQAEDEETSAEVSSEVPEKAHRLARNIVSDIALYNQEKVEEGVQAGTFFELLDKEINEGRKLFNERFPELSDNSADILQAEFDSFIERRRADIST